MPRLQRKLSSATTSPEAASPSSSATPSAAAVQLKLPISSEPGARRLRRRPAASSTPSSELFAPILDRLQEARQVTYDAETSGLDWRRNHIVGHVLTFGPGPDDTYYLPVRHGGGGNLCDVNGPYYNESWDGSLHPIEHDLVTALSRPGLTIVGHHLDFDLKMLSRIGHQLDGPSYIDTRINAALLNEYQRSYRLSACADIAGVQAKREEEIGAHIRSKFDEAKPDKEMGHYWRLAGDDPVAADYARGDGTTTHQLLDWQYGQLEAQGLMRVWDIECRLIPILARMSLKGIRVDGERLSGLKAEIKRQLEELLRKMPDQFNARSPLDVRNWMEDHGHVDWPTTPPSIRFPEGQPSFPESWLKQSPAGQQIVDIRKLTTLRDTFINPMDVTHIFKGRIHTTFNQMKSDDYGTITGRLSSSEPNMQAVSTHDEVIGRMHRSVFGPDDGLIWCDADWSQMEPRLLAHYSKCRVLVEGYNMTPPRDAHLAVAMASTPNWDDLTPEMRKARRETGKRANQTMLTGGGYKVLVDRYGMTEAEAKTVFQDYFRTMPEIKELQKRASGVMRSRGYVLTLLGRRCRLEDPGRAFVALNRLLQGGNADCIKLKMVEIDDYLKSEGRPLDVLLNCHDALSFQFSPDARRHMDECLRIMVEFGSDSVLPLDVPVVVDAGYGSNWADAKYGEAKS